MSQLFEATVTVTIKPEVADPQGQAIGQAINRLHLAGEGCAVRDVRAGRVFHFTVEAPDRGRAEATARALAAKLLANPNVETFEVALGEAVARA
jgi:phosphoribosylformylglycinamidine synthase